MAIGVLVDTNMQDIIKTYVEKNTGIKEHVQYLDKRPSGITIKNAMDMLTKSKLSGMIENII